MSAISYEDMVPVPRSAISLPLELPAPSGFVAEDASTWPKVEGRLEFVRGRLWYMPPSGQAQQGVVAGVAGVLWSWRRSHPDFFVGTNEAAMILGGEVRGADAAVWRFEDTVAGHQFARRPPVLAVEVGGRDEGERELREKARWYLDHGVSVVWLVLPDLREVRVVTSAVEATYRGGDRLAPFPALPDLAPSVSELFEQLAPA
jgi:Uma2 family endonuclease